MTEFALSRVVTVAYLFIITIKVFFIFTRTIFFSWILHKHQRRYPILKTACIDSRDRKKDQTSHNSKQIHLDNVNFENVPLRFATFNHLVYCRYRNGSGNSSCRVTVQKIKVLWPSWGAKPVKIAHRKHQGGSMENRLESRR